ncbi:MAG TPA: TetR/AcrR family transcriptional regulator [Acidimicrobiales bacterium]|nr:TetR/AcrR family transcriptional regulator [Acidimicrobiales bacterium]
MLLETGSSEAVSIRAVADAVGVTPPSIYRHFPDKTALIYEVSERRCAVLDEAFTAATAGIEDPIEAMIAVARAYVDFGRHNPEPYRLLFMNRLNEMPEHYTPERIGELMAFARAIVLSQAAIDAGRLRPEHTDATRVATLIWAHAHGLTSLLISKPTFPWPDDDAFVDEYLALVFAGLLADRPEALGSPAPAPAAGHAPARAAAQASSGSDDPPGSSDR